MATVKVFPVPGPPEITQNLFMTEVKAGTFCQSVSSCAILREKPCKSILQSRFINLLPTPSRARLKVICQLGLIIPITVEIKP